jgi:hypothetical protein
MKSLTMVKDLWPDHRCVTDRGANGLLVLFDQALADAHDEKPLQTFLANHSHLLTCLLPPGESAWFWDRPRFGSELIPDFLLCTRNSTGLHWVMIELESPARPLLTQAGLPSGKLSQALGQIRDWRIWLRRNIAYAQTELALVDLSAECRAYVIIGRRSALQSRHILKYRELSSDQTTVMTYDRLRDAIRRGRTPEGDGNG